MLRLHALITIPALIISGHADSIPLKMPLNDYYKLHSIIIGSWLKSYLHNRSQSVRVGSVSSNSFTVTTGVPQGSVLGRVLFSVYISPSNYLIATHNLQHQQYADDTQLYIAVSHTDSASSVTRLESCLTDLYCWLSHNGLSV